MSWPEHESWDTGITQNTVIVSTVTEAPHRAGQQLCDKSIWLKDIISIYVDPGPVDTSPENVKNRRRLLIENIFERGIS